MGYRIAANLVLGADGSTTLGGSSSALSFPADRVRFHQLRREFKAILIGGNTARHEPYAKTPLPLIILSHQPHPFLLESNNLAVVWNLPLREAISRATLIYGDLLLEAGPALVSKAVDDELLTELFLSVSPKIPSENQIDLASLTAAATQISEERIETPPGALFLHYRLAPSHH